MSAMKFLYVKDIKVKEWLEKTGYQFLEEKNGYWIFLNKEQSNFELQDKEIVPSNTLTF